MERCGWVQAKAARLLKDIAAPDGLRAAKRMGLKSENF